MSPGGRATSGGRAPDEVPGGSGAPGDAPGAQALGAADTVIVQMRTAFRKSDRAQLAALLPLAAGHALEPWADYWELKTPNEFELHTRLARALGRSEGNSLVAVSQKTITGHAKGGAAVFQVAGLTEILASGVAPGNASLDVVDAPLAKDAFWVWPRRPIRDRRAHV